MTEAHVVEVPSRVDPKGLKDLRPASTEKSIAVFYLSGMGWMIGSSFASCIVTLGDRLRSMPYVRTAYLAP
jgi:hypothetical protein